MGVGLVVGPTLVVSLTYILPLSYDGRMTVVYYIGYLPMQGMIKIVDLDYFVSIYILPLSYHGRQSCVTFCF